MYKLFDWGDDSLVKSRWSSNDLKATKFGSLIGTLIPDTGRALNSCSNITTLIRKAKENKIFLGYAEDKSTGAVQVAAEIRTDATAQYPESQVNAQTYISSGYLISAANESVAGTGNYTVYADGHLGTIFLLAVLGHIITETSEGALVQELLNDVLITDEAQQGELFSQYIALLSSVLYYAVDPKSATKMAEIINPTPLNDTNKIEVENIIWGDNRYFSVKAPKAAKTASTAPVVEDQPAPAPAKKRGRPKKKAVAEAEDVNKQASLEGAYEISSRTLTDEEKALVPNIPAWYKMPQWVLSVASDIKDSAMFTQAYRNVCLIGPAGTGKSKAAQVLAALWNRPHVIETCSPDDDIDKFIGRVMPKTDGTEGFEYVESNLIKALENGWVCEIQEPTILKRSSVLAGLNAIMENDSDTAVISLPNGKVVRRHPDAVVIVTSNANYDGCKGIQQSVLSRMDLVREIKNPTMAEMVERCKNQTNWPEASIDNLKLMVETMKDMAEYAEANGIEDGVIGPRELNSWAKKAMIIAKAEYITDTVIIQAAFDTVLAKATQDPDDRESLITSSFKKHWSVSTTDAFELKYKNGEI